MRFLLVDRIDDLTPGAVAPGHAARGAKLAALSEDYFEWHFPGRPIVPGMLVLEAFVQLAGWLEAASSDCRGWVLLDRVHSARYFAFAVPGDRIDLSLEVVEAGEGVRRYRGESRVGERRGSSVEFEARVVALDDLRDVDEARRTLAQLRRTGDRR